MRPTTMSSTQDLITTEEMSQDLVATEEMLQDFRCSVCKCLLTVPPIRLVEKQNVCGRCPGDGLQDASLERFASRFRFPCRYVQKGCALNLTWTEVDRHEKSCSYKSTTNCPINNCQWEETKEALVQHVESTHTSEFLTAKDSIKLSNVQVAKYFYFIGGETAFEIDIENSEETIIYKVTVLWSKEDLSTYAYKITFHNDKINLTQFRDAKMFGVVSQVNKNTIKSLTDNFDEIQLHIKIDVHDKVKGNFIECNKCSSPIDKNIYLGKCGHSLCESCVAENTKANLSRCVKNCSNNFNPRYIRSLTLETFMDSFQFNLK